ncbi:hypothetical protein, partial [Pseudomonas aeruginosa]
TTGKQIGLHQDLALRRVKLADDQRFDVIPGRKGGLHRTLRCHHRRWRRSLLISLLTFGGGAGLYIRAPRIYLSNEFQ